MPHEISLDRLPAGLTLHAARGGDTVSVQDAGAATTDDGEVCYQYLGFATELLYELHAAGHSIAPSQVDSFFAIIRRDRSATLYINELPLISTFRISRACEAGEKVTADDVIDFSQSRLGDVHIPPDAGYIAVVSHQWRKGILFDFAPLRHETPPERDYDVWPILGQIVGRLMFQERLSISRDDWKRLFACRWFPFAGLKNASIQKLLGHVRAEWKVEELLPEFKVELLAKVNCFLESWKNKEQFIGRAPLLDRAVERFEAEDYLSCTSIIYPTIEGILRAHHAIASPNTERKQNALSATAVATVIDNPYSLLLPRRFQAYLCQVFFATFDENSPTIPVSRNSVGHGVASVDDYGLEAALIALLTCHQLYYCFPPDRNTRNLAH